ncbi:YceI family protein [Cellulomonas sp. JZ18]|uniref:YceI family protein n=1 Tax=Cellulomonas sp. JZ18 TaxID=2654191 RepID=UPI0012D394EF|nr:YceI family protein [Cellulomonas sp. JZ18]QGQ20718.1 YceI family protein [Cellulomonas sp. JZ18]
MQKRTKVLAAVGVGAAVLVGVGAVLGPRLYASTVRAEAAPTLDASAAAGGLADPTSLDGTWTVGEGSFAGYRLDEVLGGEDVTVTGRTEQVSGDLTVDGGTLTAATVEVDVASIATDQQRRDDYFRGTAMQADTWPTATFTLTEPAELVAGSTDARLTGDLTIRDVTRPVTVDAEVAPTGDGVQVVGAVPVTFRDWGITPPDLGFVTVEETGAVEFDLVLTPAAG